MSTKLNGGRYSPEGSRVPYNLLEPAIRWEAFREGLCPALGLHHLGLEAGGLKRHYMQRAVDEAPQHDP